MVVKFDLSSVPELQGATITNATLGLYTTGSYWFNFNWYEEKNQLNGPKKLYEAEKSWDENSITWSSYGYTSGDGKNASTGTLITSNSNTSFNVWENYDVTSTVIKHLNNSSSNNGFMLVMDEDYYARYSAKYSSSENSTAANRPKLTITYESSGTKYSLTVKNGSGSGDYSEGSTVDISANDSTGFIFEGWIGDTNHISSTSSKNTSVTMPAKDISLTATYQKFDLTLLPQDRIINASASSEYNTGWAADLSIDDDESTYWHNATDGSDDLPSDIVYTINSEYRLTGFSYLSRQDAEGSRIINFKLEVSKDSSSWTEVNTGRGTLSDESGTQYYKFIDTTEAIKFVRFTALSNSLGDNKVSVAEFNLYYTDATNNDNILKTTNQNFLEGITLKHNTLLLNNFQSKNLIVSIFSLNGRKLFTKDVTLTNNSAKINLPQFNKGMVILKIDSKEKEFSRKLTF